MQINQIGTKAFPIVEIVSEQILIKTPQDVLDLLGEVEFANIILYSHNFEDDFFDLSTQKIGDILQKFTNYRIKVAIVGEFEKYPSKVLQQFIFESNQVGNFLFVKNLDKVKEKWRKWLR